MRGNHMKLDLTQFDALTFDVYGTLIDWEPTIISMFHSTAEQYGVTLSDEQLLMEFDKARAALQKQRPALLYPDVLRAAYGQFCRNYGIPDHAHFHAAFESFAALGIPKERILHVGQSLRADVIPANQLGVSSVWIKRPGRSLGSRPEDAVGAKPDLSFDTMQELALYHQAHLALA